MGWQTHPIVHFRGVECKPANQPASRPKHGPLPWQNSPLLLPNLGCRYLAPECCRAKWHPRSDVWAVGVMACYLLTGARDAALSALLLSHTLLSGRCRTGAGGAVLVGPFTHAGAYLSRPHQFAQEYLTRFPSWCLRFSCAGAYPFLDRICPEMPDLARTLRRWAAPEPAWLGFRTAAALQTCVNTRPQSADQALATAPLREAQHEP